MKPNNKTISNRSQQSLVFTVPEAGALLGLGRSASYAAAKRGEIPTLSLGRRLVVPVFALQLLLGPSVGGCADLPAVDG